MKCNFFASRRSFHGVLHTTNCVVIKESSGGSEIEFKKKQVKTLELRAIFELLLSAKEAVFVLCINCPLQRSWIELASEKGLPLYTVDLSGRFLQQFLSSVLLPPNILP